MPDRLRGLPLVGWLFAGLAVVGAGIELVRHGPLVGPTGLTTINLVDVIAGTVFVAAIVALPAGLLIGRSTTTRMEDRLYRGALVLALATLLGLLWEAIAWQTRAAFEADNLFEIGLGETGLGSLAILGRSVQAVLVLTGGGLIALGLRDRADAFASGPSRSSWRWPLVVAGSFATVVSLAVPVAVLADARSDPVVGWTGADLVLLLVIAATPLAWTAIALSATRGSAVLAIGRRGWRLAAAGGIVLVASTVVRAGLDLAAWTVSSVLRDTLPAIDNDVWFAWTALVGVLAAVGAVLLLAGCVAGFGSVPARKTAGAATIGHDPVDLTV